MVILIYQLADATGVSTPYCIRCWKPDLFWINCKIIVSQPLCAWASSEIFPGGVKSTFCLYFSVCWRCNANGRTQKEKCSMLRQQLHTVFSL